MKKAYSTPSLSVYGKLEGITLGVGGFSPDVAGLANNCFTATVLNTATLKIETQTCATVPS